MKTPLWTHNEIKDACLVNFNFTFDAYGVSIDSRKIKNGDIFIAIQGENMDGHAFVKDALEKGAVAAIVQYIPENILDNSPLIVVDDTMEALRQIAIYSRERTKAKIICVTGSVGKTSVKEMLSLALSSCGNVYATEGNLNNHYGLPLSLARFHKENDYGVFEIGMNHAGEISPLSVIAKPDTAIITTVEAVHLEFFNSVEEIADAKSEIFDGVKQNGSVILNRDNPHFMRLKNRADNLKLPIISFGENKDADFCLEKIIEEDSCTKIAAKIHDKILHYTLPPCGKHQAINSLSVLAAAKQTGADIDKCAKALADFQPGAGRGKRTKINYKGKNIILIDDTYNASPASIKAAVKSASNLCKNGERLVIALGDMLELGEESRNLHESLKNAIAVYKNSLVFTSGQFMKYLYESLPENMRGYAAENSEKLSPKVAESLKDGDILLVKGSRGMKMEKVVDWLIASK